MTCRALVLAALLVISYSASACDRVQFAMAVTHFNGKDYNENGPLLGCEARHWAVRYMRNSHDRDAVSVTRRFERHGLAAELGLTTGYRYAVMPWALLTARTTVGRVSLTGVFFFAGAGVAVGWEL